MLLFKSYRFFIALSVFVSFGPIIRAQSLTDPYLNSIISYITELRDLSADERVLDKLKADDKWTLMNELDEDYEGQCPLRIKMDRFGINDLAMRIEESRNGMFKSAGVFCDGTDPRFNYSFIEKSVKSGKTVNYDVPGRSGQQYILVVPFNPSANLDISIDYDNGRHRLNRDNDGTYRGDIVIERGRLFRLSITNNDSQPVSFVIVNYNEHR